MRIGFDVDDVVNNFFEVCLQELADKHNINYNCEAFTEFNVDNCIVPEHAQLLKEIFLDEAKWKKIVPPYDGLNTIDKLIKDGHEVYFVTACHPRTHYIKYLWLKEHFPQVPEDNYIFVGQNQKRMINVDILIDDNPNNLKGGLYYRVLFTKPWNMSAKESCYDIRIDNLKYNEIKEIIRRNV